MMRWLALRTLNRAIVVLAAAEIASSAALADTRTTLGESSGEGAGPFQGLMSSPGVNLSSGAMGLTVPILIPPGRANLTPALALSYSSDVGNTMFGFGWDMPLGRIERSTKYGVPSCESDPNEFVLNLNGSAIELVQVPWNTNLFRAKVDETWMEATVDRTNNSWIVRDRSGNEYQFGTEAASRASGSGVMFAGCDQTAIWALRTIKDPNDNLVSIRYENDGNTLYPSIIDYGGRVGESLDSAHPFRVTFHRSLRHFPVESRRRGVTERMSDVIHQIDVSARQTRSGPLSSVRTYTLVHTPSPDNGRTLLTSVSGSNLPTRTFEYSSSEFEIGPATNFQAPFGSTYNSYLRGLAPGAQADLRSTVLDMTGDRPRRYGECRERGHMDHWSELARGGCREVVGESLRQSPRKRQFQHGRRAADELGRDGHERGRNRRLGRCGQLQWFLAGLPGTA